MFSLPRLTTASVVFSLIFFRSAPVRIVHADVIVVPNAFEAVEGGIPAPNATDPRRVMQVFDSSQFTGFGAPLLISELALRPSNAQEAPGSLTDFNARMFFSTTSRSAATLSPNFTDNVGPDYKEVTFSESATFATANRPGPGNTRGFDVRIPLQTPFTYDPQVGNLLVEFQVGPPATEGQFLFDLVAENPTVNTVAAFGSPNADSGDLLGLGFVTQFAVQPIPKPDTKLPRGYFTDVKPVLGGARSDFLPAVSSDSQTLFFDRFSRGDSPGKGDIWMATRDSHEERFSNETPLGPDVNSPDVEHLGGIATDGLTIYFGSDRSGDWDLYQATRDTLDDLFGNVSSLGPAVNTPGFENLPDITADGLTMIYVGREPAGNQKRLWMATRATTDELFGNAIELGDAANGERYDLERPSVSADGNIIFFSDWLGTRRPDGNGQQDIWVLTRPDASQPFGEPVNLNDLWPDTQINTAEAEALPYISPDWPATGSKLYFTGNKFDPVGDIFQATWISEPSPFLVGDFNGNGQLDAGDIDALTLVVRAKSDDPIFDVFDLDKDGRVDRADRSAWITEFAMTFVGDSNLDGEFNSSDLTVVFQVGEYEDNISLNSTWREGDWNGDGDFDSGDLVHAFQDGGYELGPRLAINAVPEPSSAILLSIGLFGICRSRKRRRDRFNRNFD